MPNFFGNFAATATKARKKADKQKSDNGFLTHGQIFAHKKNRFWPHWNH